MGKLHILSTSSEPFTSRGHSGKLLARELMEYRGRKPVVLGIPRGGVVVAFELAKALAADLDIVLARKLRSPGYGELAMGSISEDGHIFLNEDVVRDLRVDKADIEQEKTAQLVEIKRRSQLIRAVKPRVPLTGRVVIITDDGVATGATTHAAVWSAHMEKPTKLILALPVGPEDTLQELARDVDELLCLRAPPYFAAVGQFYQDFEQVTDEMVLDILKKYSPQEGTNERADVTKGRKTSG
jgi:predicted phosphoribosyltransferase